ncbi:uncharacterized protein [Ptychodera flava]|uniref:uncharacterized protein isoform X1 n=1 Tax=Ptychodera flava TaxID=63121 RepID=UPI003969D34B
MVRRKIGHIFRILTLVILILTIHSTLKRLLVMKRYGYRRQETSTSIAAPQLNSSLTRQSIHRDITTKCPWIVRKNTLPNFYTRRGAFGIDDNFSPSSPYANGNVVFLHNQKSGGTTIKGCLRQIAAKLNIPQPTLIWNANAAEFYLILSKRNDSGENITLSKFYYGGHTFRVCDFASKPCSYFTVLRDPVERVISSYEFCKVRYMEPQCRVRNASEVSINEWAVSQGSFFFRQLSYNPLFCMRFFDDLLRKLVKPGDLPTAIGHSQCWYRNELIINHLLTEDDKYAILHYILDNLENWFAVIGLTEEWETTLHLLQKAYNLPFHSTCSGKMTNYHPYTEEGERHRSVTSGHFSRREIVESLKKRLWSDKDVIQALKFDLIIYERAKEIFSSQVQAYNQTLSVT